MPEHASVSEGLAEQDDDTGTTAQGMSFFRLGVLQDPSLWQDMLVHPMAYVELRTALNQRYVEGIARERVATRELQAELIEVLLDLAGLEGVLQRPGALQRVIDLLERGLMYGTGHSIDAVRRFTGALQRNDAAQRYRKAMQEAGITQLVERQKRSARGTSLSQARGTPHQVGQQQGGGRPQCPQALWQSLSDQQKKLWLDATRGNRQPPR